ncbi:thioesterase family protein [Corynebacterium glyciniphilum]|uniref:acyl-CoA thioesterase n=1 Tax=Corynebacterium glyciniphilum TaxID=1404244 RepID=UPI0023526843
MGTDATSAGTLFAVDLEFRWSDQDINGHVNNARAVTQMEEARIKATTAWLGSGFSQPGVTSLRVVRALNAVFDREMTAGPVTATVWISRIGRTSYTVSHELHQGGRRCAHGDAVIVVLDPATRQPDPISESVRGDLRKALVTDGTHDHHHTTGEDQP